MPNANGRCATCGLVFVEDTRSAYHCTATHAEGVCCHVGQLLVCEDGFRQRPVPWPDCVLVPMRWITAQMVCVICSYRWVAVYPEVAPALECDECGYMNPRHDALAERSW